jgi:hypothetical protein
MSGRTIQAGSTDQYCEVKVWTTADGVPNTTLVYNTAVMAIWYQIGNAAAVEVVVGGSPAPATMSAGGAHADWGFYHIAQGRYKIGLTDAVVSAAANVTVWIVFTDCDSAPCEIDVVAYDKTDAASLGITKIATIETSTTTTIPALIPTAGAIADQVWDEATAGHTTSGTYGGRVVRSMNSNVEVQITGSNHIAADVHEFQTGVITAADFATDAITAAALAADAVTEIQSGLALETSVQSTLDRLGFTLAALAGNCADPQTAAETYSIILGANTFTIDHTGLDATGTRTTATLTKS